jgi:hypothetical protein
MNWTLPILVSVLLLSAFCSRAAEWESNDLGQTAIVPMKSAPYPHESRAEGFTNNDKHYPADIHYSNSDVAIFLPQGWNPDLGVHLLYYFHGHGNNVRQAIDQYQLREKVVASQRNVVFVFPQGPFNAGDSGGGRLEEPGAFKAITDEVMAFLKEEGRITDQPVGKVILAGHSGAYRIMAHGAKHGGIPISEIYLIDASYGYGEEFAQWAATNPQARLRSIFTDHLAARNAWMVGRLNALDQSPRLILESDWTPELDAQHRLLFMHTTLSHNDCVLYFDKWLATSNVPPVE